MADAGNTSRSRRYEADETRSTDEATGVDEWTAAGAAPPSQAAGARSSLRPRPRAGSLRPRSSASRAPLEPEGASQPAARPTAGRPIAPPARRVPDSRGIDDVSLAELGGYAALGAAVLALVYSVAFVVLRNDTLASLALMGGGLLSTVALIAVYERLAKADRGLARLGLLLGAFGAIGAAVHGAYDLSIALHPPAGSSGGFPNPIDPRGFLTFGVSGVAILILTMAAWTRTAFPLRLLQLGIVLGVLLIATYLARLVVLDPTSPLVLAPAALAGLVASPAWYAWIGYLLVTQPEAG